MIYRLIFYVLVIVFSFYMMWRNSRVFQFRREISDIVFATDDWQWRLKVYRTVTYDQMMLQFWKPVKPESFYKDLSFLEENEPQV